MKISLDNFNQYVAVASQLAEEGLYNEALEIVSNAFEVWNSWIEDGIEIPDDIMDGQVVRLLTFCQWRAADDSDDLALLADDLNNTKCWDDSFIEANNNFSGAWIMREKALAYLKLANEWASGRLVQTYFGYAQLYIQEAIKAFSKLALEFNDDDCAELCNDCKIDLVMIQRGISNKLARQNAITLFGENLTDEQKEELMKIYTDATDVLFDDFFEKKTFMAIDCHDIDQEVKEDIFDFFLDLYSEPGNDDQYWWLFTHKQTPEERKRILFVENIEDAADNDFDQIPWVFTLDRYPFDIEFDDGEKPVDGAIYEIDAFNPNKYHRIA